MLRLSRLLGLVMSYSESEAVRLLSLRWVMSIVELQHSEDPWLDAVVSVVVTEVTTSLVMDTIALAPTPGLTGFRMMMLTWGVWEVSPGGRGSFGAGKALRAPTVDTVAWETTDVVMETCIFASLSLFSFRSVDTDLDRSIFSASGFSGFFCSFKIDETVLAGEPLGRIGVNRDRFFLGVVGDCGSEQTAEADDFTGVDGRCELDDTGTSWIGESLESTPGGRFNMLDCGVMMKICFPPFVMNMV